MPPRSSGLDYIQKAINILEKHGKLPLSALAKEAFDTATGKMYLPWIIRILLLYDVIEIEKPEHVKLIRFIKLKPNYREALNKLIRDWKEKVEPQYES